MVTNLAHFPALGNSDHEILRFNLLCYTSRRDTLDIRFNIHKGEYASMARDLQNVAWESMDPAPLEDHYKFFSDTLKLTMTKHIPMLKQHRKKKSIYMTRGVDPQE